ncbi:hypothetical protein T492DRAFT_887042 [Pavlovales sp. CCMP2436]|nr:hypothetical protein T492DRAFT_887042 [Pavlovales sp. CCMP2436]
MNADLPTLAITAAVGAAAAFLIIKLAPASKRELPHGTILYYHGACKAFTGRADAIMRMLEFAGCDYTIKPVADVPASFTSAKGCFAVPFVEFPDGLVLSQSQAIHQQLGKELGLWPITPAGEAQAMQVALSLHLAPRP